MDNYNPHMFQVNNKKKADIGRPEGYAGVIARVSVFATLATG